jgi:hypothetical protein
LATRALPTVPAAAPKFSTMMVCPSTSPSAAACSRALASMPPPAANGTIRVMVLAGHSCAVAVVVTAASANVAATIAFDSCTVSSLMAVQPSR